MTFFAFFDKIFNILTSAGKLKDNLLDVTDLVYRFSTLIIRIIVHINGGFHVEGKGNIPFKGGVIIASNHISYLDPPLIGAALLRRATFMARRGLFNIPLLGWYIKHFAIPVDREKTLPSTIKEAVRRLKNGEAIVLFPEGRRSETGELLEGRKGVGLIACKGNAAVIPTLIVGTDKVLPVGGKWFRRAKVSVIFGKPLYFHDTIEGGHESYELITQRIMNAIGELKKSYADNSS
ncbi:MAG: 1-acyl-sn-glycerol-3-phosphate acyltransferase [Nitrospirae bacterium]|nr:1-acyl-sn-glycerol-3-phosphate acyltransferase [Nitrospirota bacterium]